MKGGKSGGAEGRPKRDNKSCAMLLCSYCVASLLYGGLVARYSKRFLMDNHNFVYECVCEFVQQVCSVCVCVYVLPENNLNHICRMQYLVYQRQNYTFGVCTMRVNIL